MNHTIFCDHGCGKSSDSERWLSPDTTRFVCTDCTAASLTNHKRLSFTHVQDDLGLVMLEQEAA